MKCDHCNETAVVHEVTVKNGVKKEVHLCEKHATAFGIAPGQQPINQLLTQFVVGQQQKPAAGSRRACPGCGLLFSQFRQTGILGCASCYETFAEQLAPLIHRAHNGATHHTGKTPRRAGSSIDRQLQRQRLIKELDEAVGAEQYERAAKIRDLLNALDPADADRGATSSPPPEEGRGRSRSRG
jgi:protein arginine kinase activator